MKILIISSFIILSNLFCTCEKPIAMDVKYSITIKNQTNDTIYYYVHNSYPDTSLPNIKPFLYLARPNNVSYFNSSIKWEEYFQKLPADTLSIFFFSSDVLRIYDWQQIRNMYLILKRSDLGIDDIRLNNWTVIYS